MRSGLGTLLPVLCHQNISPDQPSPSHAAPWTDISLTQHDTRHNEHRGTQVNVWEVALFLILLLFSCSNAYRYDAGKANPRGIPQAPFVEKVEDFVKSPEEVEMVLNKFQDFLQ